MSRSFLVDSLILKKGPEAVRTPFPHAFPGSPGLAFPSVMAPPHTHSFHHHQQPPLGLNFLGQCHGVPHDVMGLCCPLCIGTASQPQGMGVVSGTFPIGNTFPVSSATVTAGRSIPAVGKPLLSTPRTPGPAPASQASTPGFRAPRRHLSTSRNHSDETAGSAGHSGVAETARTRYLALGMYFEEL